MLNRAILAAILPVIMVTACGSSEQPQVVEQIVVREPGDPAPVAPDMANDLVAMGEDAFQTCTGCHTVEAGAPSSAGPNLHRVVGRMAGSLEGYSYSDALAASGVMWDEATLDLYLADPSGYIPGSEMEVGTVTDPEARGAIVAYLASLSE